MRTMVRNATSEETVSDRIQAGRRDGAWIPRDTEEDGIDESRLTHNP